MPRHLLFAALVIVAAGCGTRSAPQIEVKEAPKQPLQAQVKVGGGDSDDERNLPFKIVRIHEKRKPSGQAPFHTSGGAWTFLDCQAVADPKVTFTVGVVGKSANGDVPVAWGDARLMVADQQAGARFVELFGKTFSGKLPPVVKRTYVLKPLAIKTAILGQNMQREGGGFSGEAGNWTATKWFPEDDGRSAEIYFNYSLASREGEFSEKDADYSDDLVAIFTTALRDGPKPQRTPETDPNLTLTGPTIGVPRKLLPRRASRYAFSPKGGYALFQERASIHALPLDKPDSKPFEVIRLDNPPWEWRVLDENLTLLVQEGIAETPGVQSSGDPMRVWWVDGKSMAKTLLRGPVKEMGLTESPVSPDWRFVALNQWQGKPGGKDRSEVVYILNRETGKSVQFSVPGQTLKVIGWKMTDAGPRPVLVSNRWRFPEDEPSQLFLGNPFTGKLERQDNADARLDLDNPLSPDGGLRARIDKESLIVTNSADGSARRFDLHEDDHRFLGDECFEWASPRYLRFNGQRLELIDVTSMKMSFFLPPDGFKAGSHSFKFSPDFRWVMYQGEGAEGEALLLAPVEKPASK